METKDLEKVYVNTIKGPVEYMGGANFLNGKRTCPHCKSNMERTPLKQPFVRVDGGKIIVDVKQSGIMIVSKADPDWNWFCTGCVLGITPPQTPLAH